MSYENTPFYVGGYYQDRNQSYEVLEMNPNGMKVKYDNGTVEILKLSSVRIKARIHQNIQAEYKFNHLSDTDAYFWTLGFLSAKGRFDAEIPKKAMSNFISNYNKLTGENINQSSEGITSLGEVDKWGAELRIYFPETNSKIDLGEDITIRDGQTPEIKRINNNSVWNKLIRIGFRLGRNHDVQKIRKMIPDNKLKQFENGINS